MGGKKKSEAGSRVKEDSKVEIHEWSVPPMRNHVAVCMDNFVIMFGGRTQSGTHFTCMSYLDISLWDITLYDIEREK